MMGHSTPSVLLRLPGKFPVWNPGVGEIVPWMIGPWPIGRTGSEERDGEWDIMSQLRRLRASEVHRTVRELYCDAVVSGFTPGMSAAVSAIVECR